MPTPLAVEKRSACYAESSNEMIRNLTRQAVLDDSQGYGFKNPKKLVRTILRFIVSKLETRKEIITRSYQGRIWQPIR